ncbi:hypothetical protein RR48_03376 [Papilio machaon]|uniref:Uncharacterized protein n=1 Tax=Papilio machaon TaxID=76193 RepID=A0A0N1PHY0_PAPMA|nr:hypothetical protein RR48_03376 [Papilio machaon]
MTENYNIDEASVAARRARAARARASLQCLYSFHKSIRFTLIICSAGPCGAGAACISKVALRNSSLYGRSVSVVRCDAPELAPRRAHRSGGFPFR